MIEYSPTVTLNNGIPREEIFLTSKVWMDSLGYEKTMKSFDQTIADLEIDYLDLLLIHWPRPQGPESWKALETLYRYGRVRAIGVSNYNIRLQQKDLRAFCAGYAAMARSKRYCGITQVFK